MKEVLLTVRWTHHQLWTPKNAIPNNQLRWDHCNTARIKPSCPFLVNATIIKRRFDCSDTFLFCKAVPALALPLWHQAFLRILMYHPQNRRYRWRKQVFCYCSYPREDSEGITVRTTIYMLSDSSLLPSRDGHDDLGRSQGPRGASWQI